METLNSTTAVSREARRWPVIVLAAALASLALLAAFCPDWWAFRLGTAPAWEGVREPAERRAVERAILGEHGLRGHFVLRQVEEVTPPIDDPNHAIIRWRLLFPLTGRLLHLPAWVTLGLAPAGCLVLCVALAWAGWRLLPARRRGVAELGGLAVVAGATAPVFTSLGWLGYYDAWVAVGLLVVAHARSWWPVVLACVLTPWVDERFVLGLPLALAVRWGVAGGGGDGWWQWFRREAALPVALTMGFALVRLHLGGTAGSPTVEDYFRQFVAGTGVTAGDRLVGAWEGLRAAWIPVAVAMLLPWWPGRERAGRLLAVAVPFTAVAGLVTAVDLSRSAVLLLPVVPLGGAWAAGWDGWRRWRWVVVALALALPAHHVVGRHAQEVDRPWRIPGQLLAAWNELGVLYQKSGDPARAAAWFRRAAEAGQPAAQGNLGVLYATGAGVPADQAVAAQWYRRAAEQGHPVGQTSLAAKLLRGNGVPQDVAAAEAWLRRAAEQGHAPAQRILGVLLARGEGRPRDPVGALGWLELARLAGDEPAAAAAAAVAAELSPAQVAEAGAWVREARRRYRR
jgi:hypothetical protein